jgi:hypothetical protein
MVEMAYTGQLLNCVVAISGIYNEIYGRENEEQSSQCIVRGESITKTSITKQPKILPRCKESLSKSIGTYMKFR